jgi:hypothetical protein
LDKPIHEANTLEDLQALLMNMKDKELKIAFQYFIDKDGNLLGFRYRRGKIF